MTAQHSNGKAGSNIRACDPISMTKCAALPQSINLAER